MSNNFKQCRKNKNLKIADVSKKLGISKNAVINIEKGSNFPSTNHLMRLSELYNASTDYLLRLANFPNFKTQYEYLQSLDGDSLFHALDSLNINEWITKNGEQYSKINDGWFVTIKNN